MKTPRILVAGFLYLLSAVCISALFFVAISNFINPTVGAIVALALLLRAVGFFEKEKEPGILAAGGEPFDWSTFWAVLLAVFIILVLHGIFHPILLRMGRAMHGYEAHGYHETCEESERGKAKHRKKMRKNKGGSSLGRSEEGEEEDENEE